MVKKLFVNSDNIATFECPKCKKSWEKESTDCDPEI